MFKRLLVPLDRSSFAEQALGPAVAIARASNAGLTLMMVHTPRPLAGIADVPWHARQVPGKDKYLAVLAEKISKGASVPTRHVVACGEVAMMICQQAAVENADLIVMTSLGRIGFDRAWIGSVADGVMRKSSAPVLMIRPKDGELEKDFLPEAMEGDTKNPRLLFRRILVPLDGSALALEVLPAASALAQCGEGHLVLLQVVDPVPAFISEVGLPFVFPPPVQAGLTTADLVAGAEQSLTQTASKLSDNGCDSVETRVVVATDAAQAIVDFARDNGIDAIGMSTHGRGVSRLLIGSVADRVLRASVLPILLRRPSAIPVTRMSEKTTAESPHLSTVTVI